LGRPPESSITLELNDSGSTPISLVISGARAAIRMTSSTTPRLTIATLSPTQAAPGDLGERSAGDLGLLDAGAGGVSTAWSDASDMDLALPLLDRLTIPRLPGSTRPE
jgi:hypothetical protein